MPKRAITAIVLAVLIGVMYAVAAMAANGSGDPIREASTSTTSMTAPANSRTLASVHTQRQANGRWLRHKRLTAQQATWHNQDLLLVHRSPSGNRNRRLQSIGYLKWSVGFWKQRAARTKLRVERLLNSHGYLPPARARVLGHVMAAKLYGWNGRQWACVDEIWGKLESGWRALADNPTSEAYGIPQADPGSKMAAAGANWLRSAHTQIAWGLHYIKGRYGSACSALSVRLNQHSY